MVQEFKNAAFLSYSRKDAKDAEWFHRDMEHVRIPRGLPNPGGLEPLPKKIGRLFRDKSDLAVSSAPFTEDIKRALAQSRFLIVLCSPNSARPNPDGEHYVDMEIKSFVDQHGLEYAQSHIVPVVIAGDIKSVDSQSVCIPPVLREIIPGLLQRNLPVLERSAPDAVLTKEAREEFVLRSLSFLIGVEYAGLNDRFRKEQRARIRNWLVAALCLILVLAALAAWAVIERKSAILNEGKAQTALSHSNFREASRLIEQGETGMALSYLASSLKDITLKDVPLYRPAFERFYGLLLNRSWLVPHKVSSSTEANRKIAAVSDSLDVTLYDLGKDPGGATSRLLVSRTTTDVKPHEVQIAVDGFLSGAFNHNEKMLLTLAQNGSGKHCHIWRTSDGNLLGKFELPVGFMPSFISNTGAYVVLLSSDATMRLVSVRDGKTVLERNNDSGFDWGRFDFDDEDRIFAAAQVREDSKNFEEASAYRLHTYNMVDSTELCTIDGTGTSDGWALSPAGSFIAYVVSSSEPSDWKLISKPLRNGFADWTSRLTGGFKQLAFSPDGVNLVVEAGWQDPGSIEIYDVYTGPPSRYSLRMGKFIKNWAFSHDAGRLAMLDEDNEVQISNMRDGSQAVEKLTLTTEAHSLKFSRNDRFVWVRTAEQGVLCYGIQISPHRPRKLSLESIMILTDVVPSDTHSLLGFIFGNGQNAGELQVRFITGNAPDINDTQDVVSLPKEVSSIPIKGHPNCGAFSPDGSVFVLGTGVPTSDTATGRVFIYDIPENNAADIEAWKERSPIDLPYAVIHANFSPDGSLLVLTGLASNKKASKAYLYDVASKKLRPFEIEHDGAIDVTAFSPEKQHYRLITAGSDKMLKTWDVRSGKMLWQSKLDSFPHDIAVSQDGKIACGMRMVNTQGCIQVFSAQGTLLWKRCGLRHAVNHVTFDDSGSLLAVGFRGNKAIILNAADGRPRTQELLHFGEISALSFTPQGDTVALCVGGGDTNNGYVDCWDPVSSKKVDDSTRHDNKVRGLWISKDGRVVSWSREVQVSPSPILFSSQQLIQENYDFVAGTLSGWTLDQWRAPEPYTVSLPPTSSGPLTKALAWLSDFSDSRALFPESGIKLSDRLDRLARGKEEDCRQVLDIRPDNAKAMANTWLRTASNAAEEDFLRPSPGMSSEEKRQREMEWINRLSQKKWSAIDENPKALRLADFHTREACDKRPDAASSWRERAAFLRLTNRLDEAVVALNRSVELDPSDIDASIQLALIYQRKNNNSAALDVLNKTCDEMAATGNGTIGDVSRVGYETLLIWAVERGFSEIDGRVEWILEQIRRRAKASLSMDDQTSLVDLSGKVSSLLLAAEDGPKKALEFNVNLIALLRKRSIPPLESTMRAFTIASSYCALMSGDIASVLQYTADATKSNDETATFSNMNRSFALCASGRIPEAMDLVRNILKFDMHYDGFISLQMAKTLQELHRHGITLPCENELNTQLAPLISDRIAKGLSVREVVSGGQGERLGVKVGDRIIRYDGEPILDLEDFTLSRNLEKYSESNMVRDLVIVRNGEEFSFKVKPGLLGLQLVPGE